MDVRFHISGRTRSDMEEAVADAQLKAWKRGVNPDRVDPDRIAYAMESRSYSAEEAISRELDRIDADEEVK